MVQRVLFRFKGQAIRSYESRFALKVRLYGPTSLVCFKGQAVRSFKFCFAFTAKLYASLVNSAALTFRIVSSLRKIQTKRD